MPSQGTNTSKAPIPSMGLIGTIKQAAGIEEIDNEFILRGYRIGFNNVPSILKSLCLMHNESVNIWSHLIGVMIFLALVFYTVTTIGPRIPQATSEALFARMQLL